MSDEEESVSPGVVRARAFELTPPGRIAALLQMSTKARLVLNEKGEPELRLWY